MLSRHTHQSTYLNCLLPAAFLTPVPVWLRQVTGNAAYSSGDEYSLNLTTPETTCRLRTDSQSLTLRNIFSFSGMVIAVTFTLSLCLNSAGKTVYIFLPVIPMMFMFISDEDTFSQFTGAAFFSYFCTLLIITFTNHET
jgi:hypothetical protein